MRSQAEWDAAISAAKDAVQQFGEGELPKEDLLHIIAKLTGVADDEDAEPFAKIGSTVRIRLTRIARVEEAAEFDMDIEPGDTYESVLKAASDMADGLETKDGGWTESDFIDADDAEFDVETEAAVIDAIDKIPATAEPAIGPEPAR